MTAERRTMSIGRGSRMIHSESLKRVATGSEPADYVIKAGRHSGKRTVIIIFINNVEDRRVNLVLRLMSLK